jgi:hypothetical protein
MSRRTGSPTDPPAAEELDHALWPVRETVLNAEEGRVPAVAWRECGTGTRVDKSLATNRLLLWMTSERGIPIHPQRRVSFFKSREGMVPSIFEPAHTAALFNDLKKANTEAAKRTLHTLSDQDFCP